jgi:DNA-directed RNA polymerase subunit RPC12/RpoP
VSLSSVGCTRCGSNELTEVDGFLQCVYCQSRYAFDKGVAASPRQITSITSQQQIEKLGPNYEEMSATQATETSLARSPSSRSWTVALVLSLFLGFLGVDRLYLGQVGLGVAKFLTAGGFGVWWVIDCVLIALRRAKDSDGRILR